MQWLLTGNAPFLTQAPDTILFPESAILAVIHRVSLIHCFYTCSAEIFSENERNWSLTKIQRKESRDLKARRAIIIFTIIKIVNSNTVDNLLNGRKTRSGHVNT